MSAYVMQSIKWASSLENVIVLHVNNKHADQSSHPRVQTDQHLYFLLSGKHNC